MAFEVGSMRRGRRVKDSRSSMVEGTMNSERKNL
jgi:hypothetical protein